MRVIPLTELPPERCASIARLDAGENIVNRLNGLALCVGRVVEMVQAGDPLIVRACGTRVGLARDIARRIQVEGCDESCDLQHKDDPS